MTTTQDNRTETRAAIRTRYAGPTNSRGSRIIASAKWFSDQRPRRITYHWDYALDVAENHAAAAQAWLDRFNDYGATIEGPGLNYDGDYHWTWSVAQ